MIALMLLWTAITASAADLGPVAPYYDSRQLRLNLTLPSLDDGSLRMVLTQQMESRIKRIHRQQADGTRVRVRVRGLETAEMVAALVALSFDIQGAEADLVVANWDGKLIPVTVWWDDRKSFALRAGEPLVERIDATITPERVQEKYGLLPFVDRDRVWDVRTLQLVDEALARLGERELASVRQVPFHRVSAPSDALRAKLLGGREGEPAAVYVLDDLGPRIEVYNAATHPPGRFSGTPDDPRPQAFMVILHELGHVVSRDEHRRMAMREREIVAARNAHAEQIDLAAKAFDEQVAAFNAGPRRYGRAALEKEHQRLLAMIAENEAMLEEIDAVRAQFPQWQDSHASTRLSRVLGADGPPTHYGMTSDEEAFADCFALFHADPAALLRARPAVHAWLAAGGHLLPEQGTD